MDYVKKVNEWLRVGLKADDAIGVRGCGIEQFIEHLGEGGIPAQEGVFENGVHFYPYLERVNDYLLFSMSEVDIRKYSIEYQIKNNHKDYSKFGAFVYYCSDHDILLTEEEFMELYDHLESGIDINTLVKKNLFDRLKGFTNLSDKGIGNIIKDAFLRVGMQFTLSKSALKYKTIIEDPVDALIVRKGSVYSPGFNDKLPLEHISGIKVYSEQEMNELLDAVKKLNKESGK